MVLLRSLLGGAVIAVGEGEASLVLIILESFTSKTEFSTCNTFEHFSLLFSESREANEGFGYLLA